LPDEKTGVEKPAEETRVETRKAPRIPLPPQLKLDEERKKESEGSATSLPNAKVSAKTSAVVQAAATLQAAAQSQLAQKVTEAQKLAETTCASCKKELSAENAKFSFCVHCGADLPRANAQTTVPPVQRHNPVQPPEMLANGVRDPRTTMRRIAQVHSGQVHSGQAQGGGQAQAQLPQQTQQTQTQQQGGVVLAQIELDAKREINPTVNAICSFFLPGVGQMLNGQVGKGLLLLVGLFIAISVLGWHYFSLPLLIGQVLSSIDAYRIGERRRNSEKVADGEWDIA
jgi:TM2 domain-containing membrane protein YozV